MQTSQYNKPSHDAARITKEYEDFAYIVSHDLNAPLRHIKEFTRLLIGSTRDNLDDEEKSYVQFLEKSLERIDVMQQALLTFSRLDTHAQPLRDIDCNMVVENVLEELVDIWKRYKPVFQCDDLPIIMADPRQMHVLFSNLIENALKFHEDDNTKREISITVKEEDSSYLFQIKDNGIGIDPKNHEEVFRLFRRLNPEKYDGVGVGLSIARKIVRRHGGDIYIESNVEEGSRIFFSIAKASDGAA